MSSTSDPTGATPGPRPVLALVTLAVVAAAVVRALQSELAAAVVREQVTYEGLRLGFVAVSGIGAVVVAITVFVAPASRVPGTSVVVSVLAAVLGIGYTHLRSPGFAGPHQLAWVAAFALTPALVDLVVAAYAGRVLPQGPVLVAGLAVSLLGPVLSLGQQLDYVGGVGTVVRDPYFAVNAFVIGPVVILAGVTLGRLLGLRWSRRSVPAAG